MAIRIGANIASLGAQRRLNDATSAVSSSVEKLSSGLRINHASDDPAGLAVASSLRADVRVFSQAIRNINDGISALNVAEGALSELSSIATRQRELATQAANDTYSLKQRRAMNEEANLLGDEFNRIVATTKFNGINLLDGSTQSLSLQAGYGAEGVIAANYFGSFARTVGTGSFEASQTYATGTSDHGLGTGDFDGDGTLDIVTSLCTSNQIGIMLGNSDGTFNLRTVMTASTSPGYLATGDLNGDEILDIAVANANYSGVSGTTVSVFMGNGNGTFAGKIDYTVGVVPFGVVIADFNNDGKADIATPNCGGGTGNTVSVLMNNGNGTFLAKSDFIVGTEPLKAVSGDVNGDGNLDIVTTDNSSHSISVLLGNGNGSFRTASSFFAGVDVKDAAFSDLNGDGYLDLAVAEYSQDILVLLGNGDGSFKYRGSYGTYHDNKQISLTDVNNDGIADAVLALSTGGVDVLIANGDGSFRATQSFSTNSTATTEVAVGDFNKDGAVDIATSNHASNSISVLLADTIQVSTMQRLDLQSTQGARESMAKIDATLERISRGTSAIGSCQSRLKAAVDNLYTMKLNYIDAGDRISSADIAEESVLLVMRQILQQAATAVLGQANQLPALALTLLR